MLKYTHSSRLSQTANRTISRSEAHRLIRASGDELDELFEAARQTRNRRTGATITYSRKVFVPLTNLCRDRCAYCTFARSAEDPAAHTMTAAEVLAVAAAGKRAGCKEVLFSLGDKPELRYPAYKAWLAEQGFRSTIEYLAAMCQLVFEETGLLPHSNPGVLTRAEIELLQPVNVSMGMMIESTSDRLLAPGEAHYQCPDKVPAVRLRMLRDAGEAGIPFTTGILIGIGETLEERVDALFAIKDLHDRYGHIQEVIIQNFRAKTGTAFEHRAEPDLLDLSRTAAVARLIFGLQVNLQIPPNLTPGAYDALLRAGINDWGGVSPVTLDFINPERVWPKLVGLREATAGAGFELRERLAVYPQYVVAPSTWITSRLHERVADFTDSTGLVRRDQELW
ncbi:MAG TPA: 7,8-didemethyl-8-hydroxy-5-deazariboflavin synthase CofG [Bryobacteraceae bacterium]|nr:7,8-didemethyl-8-hydroxy-5-deazariboflavin synthase CofG [Bryobacteraceae bacterium]